MCGRTLASDFMSDDSEQLQRVTGHKTRRYMAGVASVTGHNIRCYERRRFRVKYKLR